MAGVSFRDKKKNDGKKDDLQHKKERREERKETQKIRTFGHDTTVIAREISVELTLRDLLGCSDTRQT